MNVTLAQTEKLLRSNRAFTQLGFSMMLTRLKTIYAKNPTQATLQACADEINVFLNKFNMIMAADYAVITSL